MTMDFTFLPDFGPVGSFRGLATVAELAEETGVYSASPDFVRANCGPLAVSILDAVPADYYDRAASLGLYPNIDVRIHRLYPGDFPAVPGWHADGEFRADYHSQPELDKIPEHSHLTGTISTDENGVSLTQLVTEPFTANIVNPDVENTLWSQVHRQVDESNPAKTSIPDGQLTSFSSFTLHRATPATVRGWRLFFRISMWHRPYLSEAGGSISRQEQVYRVAEHLGW
jgi:hypothetical protein